MNPLIIAGLVSGGIGLAKSIFGGNSEEEERQNRLRIYLSQLKAIRQHATDLAYRRSAGLVGSARQAAGARAAAMGRAGSAESFILPAEDQAARIGNQNIEDTNQRFDTMQLQAEGDFAGRPIQPGIGDQLEQFGGGLINYGLMNDRNDTLRKGAGMQSVAGSQQDVSGGDTDPLGYKKPYWNNPGFFGRQNP